MTPAKGPSNLSLNPEDLAEIAYAVLVHHDSDASWEASHASVREQIDEHRRGAETLTEAMREPSAEGD